MFSNGNLKKKKYTSITFILIIVVIIEEIMAFFQMSKLLIVFTAVLQKEHENGVKSYKTPYCILNDGFTRVWVISAGMRSLNSQLYL
jgi:hypothetical protein